MFEFLSSLFRKSPRGPEATPLIAEEDPNIQTPRSKVIDISGMIFQASTRVPLGRLLASGRKNVNVLSKGKIDDLINRAVRNIVDRYRLVDKSSSPVPEAAIATEARKEFDTLLAQYLRSAQDGDSPDDAKPFEIVSGKPRPDVTFEEMQLELGRGLHVGTVNLVAAAKLKSVGDVVYCSQRNAFLDVLADDSTKKLMRHLGIGYISQGDAGYIVGEGAIGFGRIFGKSPRRPMKHGTLSPDEPVALFILSLLIKELMGFPRVEGEVCVYSVPADPVEGDRNYIYHRGAIESALKSLGYTPRPMVESHLIVSNELKDQDYTGIGLSCGAGMVNVGVAYKGVPAINFSTLRGGDWIDQSVADAVGVSPDRVREVKEGGMDLRKPNGRIEGAIAIYYRHLLAYTVDMMRQKMSDAQNMPSFAKAVPIVCAGGASRIPGFMEMLKDELEKVRGFPVRIDFIRMAKDPMHAVASGCLQAALEETAAQEEPQTQAAPSVLERAAVSSAKKGLPSLVKFRSPFAA
jgi:hypothetical protein